MKNVIIPETYEEWRHCILVECGLNLTKPFIEKRITALQNKKEHYTQQFIKRYGQRHHLQVLNWFTKAAEEL